jgi:hypothetical protein
MQCRQQEHKEIKRRNGETSVSRRKTMTFLFFTFQLNKIRHYIAFINSLLPAALERVMCILDYVT